MVAKKVVIATELLFPSLICEIVLVALAMWHTAHAHVWMGATGQAGQELPGGAKVLCLLPLFCVHVVCMAWGFACWTYE